MFRLALVFVGSLVAASAFQSSFNKVLPKRVATTTRLALSKSSSEEDTTAQQQQQAFAVGTFVEFQEKKRTHIGKITAVEHKSSGGARYKIVDAEENKTWDIADKALSYTMPAPNAPGPAEKLYKEFLRAQDAPLDTLQQELDMTPELLEMAWEEAIEDEDANRLVTAASLVESVQGHAATAMEKYLAWQLLKTDMAHVFFKEIKDHGRVVAFKAKTRKAAEAAKEAFCKSHVDSDLCFV